jgi:signal peptidase I
MILNPTNRIFSKAQLGLLLLTLYCVTAILVLCIGTGAMWLRSPGLAILRIFSVESASMLPTLHAKDYILSVMYTWQERKVERGDIILHYRAGDKRSAYISRVIGLEGDRIQLRSGHLYINDEKVPKERVEDYRTSDMFGQPRVVARYREVLSEGSGHSIVIVEVDGDRGYFDNTDVMDVPEGEVFVMSDNRDNSSDSRDRTIGTVPVSLVLGYPILIVWSKDKARLGLTPR